MAFWRKNKVMSAAEQKKLQEKRANDIVPNNSFYTKVSGSRPNERYEKAGNRRAADVYVQNF